ncbi:ChrR family anti-sigma-E factor [Simiduia aestuariiviva]|uniref:Putative transcriptional regulator n=1 Tax=Simiduia aestuariiviva TaxID=1510459 RepID=A0A839UV23_9GAMM|nr:ChrR family anti-sigma-E factor [Simiduia aestuariiviva]MBB3169328.1 putative transcriptional regulator [Simiduia aestuariiviva]
MIKHHPDDNLLIEFSAGTLAFGQSIAVSSHLHFCHHCQQRVERLNHVGASLLTDVESVPVSDDLLDSVMAQLDAPTPKRKPAAPSNQKMPRVIDKILSKQGKAKWEFLTPSLDMARLHTGQQQFEVALHRIKAGGSVAQHDHRGTEITLVLDGSFSDENGIYNEGDFLVRDAGQVHRPLASRDAPCICLSVVAAPVRMTGPFMRLLNPFLSFKPL